MYEIAYNLIFSYIACMKKNSTVINLVKLCVGVQEIAQLEQSAVRARKAGQSMWLSTRNMPKQREALLENGSLYWVISGKIQVRQRILAMDMGETEMGKRAVIKLEPHLILTQAYPKRPFQGWRYLKAVDTPPDLSATVNNEAADSEIVSKQNIISQKLPSSIEKEIKAALAW